MANQQRKAELSSQDLFPKWVDFRLIVLIRIVKAHSNDHKTDTEHHEEQFGHDCFVLTFAKSVIVKFDIFEFYVETASF